MTAPTVTVRIDGDDRHGPVAVECVISADRLPRVMAALFAEGIGDPTVIASLGASPPVGGRSAEVSSAGRGFLDYLRAKPARGFAEILLIAGRFLQVHAGRWRFTRADVRRLLRTAPHLRLPRNFNRDFSAAVNKGYLRALDDGQHFEVAAGGLAWLGEDG